MSGAHKPLSILCNCGHTRVNHTIRQDNPDRPGCTDCFCSGFSLRHPIGCICQRCIERRRRAS